MTGPIETWATRRRRLLVAIGFVVIASLLTYGIWWRKFGPVMTAERLLRDGRVKEALPIADKELERYPQWQTAMSIKARAHTAAEQWNQAIAAFESYPVSTRRDLAAWSQVLLHEKRWEDALPICELRVSQDEQDGDALSDLATCQIELSQLHTASQSADRLLHAPGYASHGEYFLGVINRRTGDSYGAMQHWKQLLVRNPDAAALPIAPATFFYELGKVCHQLGNVRQAAGFLQQSLNLRQQISTLNLAGQAFSLLGDVEQATKAWKAVLVHDDLNFEARIGLADLTLTRDDAPAAIEWLLPVSAMPKNNPEVAFLLQRAYTRTGELEKAQHWQRRTFTLRRIERIESAIARLTGQTTRVYWTSVLNSYELADAGRWDEAKVIARLAVQYDPLPFVAQLSTAIESEGSLPDLDDFFNNSDGAGSEP